MKSIKILFFFVVYSFLALGIYYLISCFYEGNSLPDQTANYDSYPFEFSVDEIENLIITLEDGTTLILQRQTESIWYAVENTQITFTTNTVDLILRVLLNSEIIRELDTDVLPDMGLDRPTMVINLTLTNSEQHQLTIGDATFDGYGYYVIRDGSTIMLLDYESIFTALDSIYMYILPSFYPSTNFSNHRF